MDAKAALEEGFAVSTRAATRIQNQPASRNPGQETLVQRRHIDIDRIGKKLRGLVVVISQRVVGSGHVGSERAIVRNFNGYS